ncbi:MAG: hypothetical protein H0T46_12640 [Deltaproteobacteria bacterium]|nr:hypothetical protein [Deltaproteobacteria bacterium]
MRTVVVTMILLASGHARAEAEIEMGEPANDGYCDYVQGVASAQAAVMFAPTVFGQFGLIEQAAGAANPDIQSGGLRLISGVRVSLDGIYKGLTTRDRARADCRRHKALSQISGETQYIALDARAKVLDAALAETDKILGQTKDDLDARRTTAQEATATRLRVEELRQLATQTHREMGQLPPPSGSIGGALRAFERADADVESYEGKLRRADAFDVSIRVGVDQFLDRSDANPSPYFAVVAIGVNLGVLFQGRANERAAAGRRRLLKSGRDPLTADATGERLRAIIEAETKREQETAALEADLRRQHDALTRLGGEESKRYKQTVWFELIKIRAEHAYLSAHLRAMREVIGDGGGP